MSFGFSAPCPYLLDGIKFCFHLNPIFRLLPSKTVTMKKITTLKERWWTIQSQLRQKKEILSEVQRFTQKSGCEGFALCTVCRSDFSVAYGGENDINRHKDTSKRKGYVDTAQRQKINRFWCKLSDCKLRPKSSES